MVVTRLQINIKESEYQMRCDKLLEYLKQQNLTGAVIFDRTYILYYTGFAFIPTERPIGFVVNTAGERGLFVPRLEVEHARSSAIADRVTSYDEFPGNLHPMNVLVEMMGEMGIGALFGADDDGYPWILGYRGESLSGLTRTNPHNIRPFIEDQMMVKSHAELALIGESVRWGHLAHILLQRYTRVNLTETEVSQRASNEATRAMLDTIGPIYRGQGWGAGGASAGYRGQIGRNSTIPHALANNLTFQSGDVLVTGAGASVWGYNSELERTMIMGTPTQEQRTFFDHMLNLQETAFAAMRPGTTCAEVDLAVRAYFESHDLMPYWRHHTGHAIGLRYHEGPFLDTGDHTVLLPGMVFTVEPGLYVPAVGGFRHSDTVCITEDGVEIMTYYPRDIESLTLPV